MRILVISDSHRRSSVVDKIIAAQPEARYVFFLGDNVGDIEDFEYIYPDKKFCVVSGNCDFASMVPSVGVEMVAGKKILYTHGHNFGVKYSLEKLKKTAIDNNCHIVLFGHTHVSKVLYEDGVYIVNPGSCSNPRDGGPPSYAVIDITDGGIMPIIVQL